jgi:hypothetical protein
MLEGSGIYLVAALIATVAVLAAYAFSLGARMRDAERDLEAERGAGRR